jgi:hypothetical protein
VCLSLLNLFKYQQVGIILEGHRLIVKRRFVSPSDKESNAGGSINREFKGMGHKKCSPRSFRLGVGCGANNPTLEKFTVTKPPKSHGGGQYAHRIVAPVKNEKNKQLGMNTMSLGIIYPYTF